MAENDQVTTFNSDPAANAPDAAAPSDKGKGKAVEDTSATQDMSMDEDEESEESENDEEAADEEDDEHDNLEPISSENIITSGGRTRGKTIDFAEAAEKSKSEGDEMDDDEDDEDFNAPDDDDDDQMRG